MEELSARLRSWQSSLCVKNALAALISNGFQTVFVNSRQEALERALEIIPPNAKVGVGGSVTIREIGLVEALIQRGNTVYEHWMVSRSDITTTMRKELASDIFLTSSNAITEDGKLVNIDGVGNRVGGMAFGPKRVIVIAGKNKIVKNTEEGINRAKNIAAPMNAKRLAKNTPCSRTGRCTDCDAADRICRITTIIERKPRRTEITVMLIGEELGL